jgi:hypothetical protein
VVRGLAVLAASWTLLLALLEWRVSGLSAIPATFETAVIALLALSAAALLARRGEPEPGNLVGSAVVLTGVGALLVQPLLGVTIFLSVDSTDEQAASGLAWWAAVPRRRGRPRPGQPRPREPPHPLVIATPGK